MLTFTGMVEADQKTVLLAVCMGDVEPHFPVESDGVRVDRRGYAVNLRAAQFRCTLKEREIQQSAVPFAAICRGHADEVNIGDAWSRLRAKANKKRLHCTVLDERKARRREVLEEQPRQEVTHGAPAPPLVDNRRDDVIVGGSKRSDRHGKC